MFALFTKLFLYQKTVILNYQLKQLSNFRQPHTIAVKAREGEIRLIIPFFPWTMGWSTPTIFISVRKYSQSISSYINTYTLS